MVSVGAPCVVVVSLLSTNAHKPLAVHSLEQACGLPWLLPEASRAEPIWVGVGNLKGCPRPPPPRLFGGGGGEGIPVFKARSKQGV